MRIGELSRRTGASLRSLRHYEKRRALHSRRLDNGYREYEDAAVERVHLIRRLLDTGFNMEDVRKITQCIDEHGQPPTCGACGTLYARKLAEVEQHITELLVVRDRLSERLAQLRHAPMMMVWTCVKSMAGRPGYHYGGL